MREALKGDSRISAWDSRICARRVEKAQKSKVRQGAAIEYVQAKYATTLGTREGASGKLEEVGLNYAVEGRDQAQPPPDAAGR